MVDIKVYQHDESANDRSEQLFVDLKIEGALNERSKAQTKALFDWSTEREGINVYKNVQIKVFDYRELLRVYSLENMFCASYQETFNEYASEQGSIGSFVLEMKQRRSDVLRKLPIEF